MLKYKYKLTCGACPEQYDVYDDDGNQVAYIRLRHGSLKVAAPDVDGEIIYSHTFEDGLKGCFDNDSERDDYIDIIDHHIQFYYEKILL